MIQLSNHLFSRLNPAWQFINFVYVHLFDFFQVTIWRSFKYWFFMDSFVIEMVDTHAILFR